MAPCVTERVGVNGLADRDQLVSRLEQLARGEEVTFEQRGCHRVAGTVATLHKEGLAHPQLLVAAPTQIRESALRFPPPGIGSSRPAYLRVLAAVEAPENCWVAIAAGNDWEQSFF